MNLVSKLLVSSVVVLSSTAHAITIDGNLNDWIGMPTGSSNDWIPSDPSVKYTVEDQDESAQKNGSGSYGYLNPGYGGQAYDAEAIYIKSDAENFYVAVVTGLSPGSTAYPAGDLAFDFGRDGSYEYGVIVLADSTILNANNAPIAEHRGEVYKVSQWNVGLWDASGNRSTTGDPKHPTTVKVGAKLADPSLTDLSLPYLVYNLTPIGFLGEKGGNHYVIEARIPKSVFGSDVNRAFNLHWTMACANDSILVDPSANVPTPTILPMLGLGLTMLIGSLRSKKVQSFSSARF